MWYVRNEYEEWYPACIKMFLLPFTKNIVLLDCNLNF